MNQTCSAALGVLGILVTTTAFAKGPTAAAGPDRKACIAAADDGQKLRDDGKLTVAREKFIMCASKSCPGAISKECSQWLQETDRDTPSVTFRALDERGKEIFDVRISIDDQTVAESIDARAIPFDPGEHNIRFDRADGKSVEGKIVLRPAEKNRIIELAFEKPKETTAPNTAVSTPPPPPSDPPRHLRIPVLGWVGIGVAVAGAGMTAFFATKANDDEDRLRSTCAPSCLSSQRDSLDSKILLANVGLGVSVVGAGVAIVSTLLANTGHTSKTGRLSPTFAPSHGGASLGMTGAF
jgi:hypothetical protein